MEDTAAGLSSLPDDMLREILFRVRADAAALFQCAMVCKRWRRLVADPSFLRRCWPEPSYLAGFFSSGKQPRHGQWPCFVPTPGSLLGGGRGIRALESFVPGATAGLFRAVPLACRHGLLLVRLPWTGADLVLRVRVRLAVCNLLTGACHVLPPLDPVEAFSVQHKTVADFPRGPSTTDKPSSIDSTFFKVLLVGSCNHRDDINTGFGLYMFSSGSGGGRWSTSPERFRGVGDRYGPFRRIDAVVRPGGTAHWLFSDLPTGLTTLRVDAGTGAMSVTKIPPLPMNYINSPSYLGVAADGTLSLLRIQRRAGYIPRLEIWRDVDDDDDEAARRKGLYAKTVELRLPEDDKRPANRGMSVLVENCGKVFILDFWWDVYVADLETGAMEKVTDWPRLPQSTLDKVVPLEMDWPPMFVSRLGIFQGQ
ncbi:hypothetical protein BRADI_2g62093v3 [Brachypodium distachyon]|uniref:F-box domain-containing protein n=1 Tax=Brachypodium distachyon TaxID=15368 RepID=I1HVM8_BRADI|nr:hypothetical protein BRADI_2g62093v3 [Brachypodium distachyon]